MIISDFFNYVIYCLKKAIFGVICVFPLKNNQIIFHSHRGASQYSDSPMYITEYLLKHYPGVFDVIWEVNNPDNFLFLAEKGIKTVKFGTLRNYYLLNTSKVCITNAGFAHFVERENQLRINTWHSGFGYKSGNVLGSKAVKMHNSFQKKIREKEMNQYNVLLSSCDKTTKVKFRNVFRYHGNILECGLPRNDIMFTDSPDIKDKVYKWFNIDDKTDILLVAPTWKSNDDTRNIQMSYSKICEQLEKKTGRKWVVLLRLHHLSNVNISTIVVKNNGKVYDATKYPDVQELLYTADMLITDYSSVIWDFALTKKPIILFMPDLSEYEEVRGFDVPVDEWGLIYVKTDEELLDVLNKYTMKELRKLSEKHTRSFGSYENGHATERVVKEIVEYCRRN